MKRVILLALLLLGDVNSPFDPSSSSSITAYASNNNRDGGCNACRMHEEIRALSLEAIKEQILNRLGLKQAPNMTGRALPRIPPISKLMDMYGMQADQPQSHEPGITYHEQIDEYSAKTESVFALAHPQRRLKYSQGSLEVLYFKFSDKIIQHRVTKAELSLWIQEKELVVNPDETLKTFVKHDGRDVNEKMTREEEDDEVGEEEEEEEDEEDEGEKETTHHYHHHFHHRRYKYHHRHRRNHRHNNRRQHHDITQRDQSELVTITLQRILREQSDNGAPLLGPPLKTKHLRPNGGKDGGSWVTIQLGRMVTEWFKHPRDNLGVVLKIDDDDDDDDDDEDGGGAAATDNDNDDDDDDDDDTDDIHTSIGVKKNLWHVETDPNGEYAPYLEIQIQDRESRGGARVKRNVGLNCDEASQETRCCRYKLTVDFEKFGWDWIIAPKKYDANYCSGDCPMAFLPAYPNTHIVSLAEPPNNTGPCCAPRKLSEITMLYFDNEYQIVFSRLPGMVVERCGCS